MSSVVKTASFAAFLRLFLYALSASIVSVSATLWAITMLTIVVGNVIALYQQSFKRMLAYSSISHAGYMMMAILSLGVDSGNAIFIYATAYSIASVIAFAVLIKVKEIKNSESFEAFNGLGKTNPLLALSLTIAMCSFAGIPLTAGFFGKFFIFTTTLAQHYYWLVGIAIVNAVIGIWYYFRVIIAMYMKPAESNEPIVVSSNYKIILWLATILTLLFGIYPSLITSLF